MMFTYETNVRNLQNCTVFVDTELFLFFVLLEILLNNNNNVSITKAKISLLAMESQNFEQ